MNNKQKIKDTELGRTPKEWGIVRLGDVVDLNKESRDPSREFPDKKFLYIDIDSVGNGTGIIRSTRPILGKESPSRARRVVHYNDILMSMVRPYLKAFAIVPKEYDNQICSTGFAVLTCKEKILPHYLLYAILSKSVIDQCNRMMVGAQYPALNSSQVEKIRIPLPPIPEQQKIAEVLSTVDEAIGKVDEAIEKTQRLKKGLMEELLIKGIGHKEFKETEIGRIPKEWGIIRLEDAVESIKRGPFGGSIKKEIFVSKGYKVYEQKNVICNYFTIGNYYIDAKKYNELKSFAIKEDDILLTGAGTIGKVAVVPKDYEPGIINQALIKITLDKSKIIVPYFFNLLVYAPFRNKVLGSSHGATMKNISSVRDLKSIAISLPSLPEQQKIAEILSTVDRRLELLREKKERFEKVKKGLMNDLLTGKRRYKK